MQPLKKLGVKFLSWAGPRKMISLLQKFLSGSPIFYFPSNNENEDKFCCLTIDDAPGDSPENNDKLLSILNKNKVKATFFIISSNATRSKENEIFLKEIINSGHQIGNHMNRDQKASGFSENEFEKELLQCEEILKKYDPLFSEKPFKCFRPPSGSFNSTMTRVLEKHNYKNILGDVYSCDANIEDPDFHARFIRKNLKNGSIIILHTPNKETRVQTLQILESLIPEIQSKGFKFLTLEEAFHKITNG